MFSSVPAPAMTPAFIAWIDIARSCKRSISSHPIVDDPFSYGAIAATNALSDVFAMGGRPLTALNIVGIPEKTFSPKIVADILRGGLSKANEAGCAVVGGHTIRAPEPIYGMAVTGIVDPTKMMTNAKARPGDLLVLTKPLGTGIATTAIKRGLASRALEKKVDRAHVDD